MGVNATDGELSTKQRAFLEAYVHAGTIYHAAKAAKVERKSHYRWLERENYKTAFEEAAEEATQLIEAAARKRGR